MKQSKKLALAIIALACALVSLGGQYPVLALGFIPPAALFGLWWYYTYRRDTTIIANARQHQLPRPAPQPQIDMVNEANHCLFVPDPLT